MSADPTQSRVLCGAKCRDGHACTQQAMHFQTRCRMHGAKSGFKLRAAERRAAEAKATKAIERHGIEPAGDPVELMRRFTAKAVAAEAYFDQRLKALEEVRYQVGAGEQTRAEVQLWERALDRAQKFAHDLAKLDLDTRQIRVSEAQLVLLVGVISRGLARAEIPDDLRQLVRVSIATEMRTLEARSDG